jgi:cysteine-rich repeat protein
MKHTLQPAFLSSLLLAACPDPSCPVGSARLGDTCLADPDASSRPNSEPNAADPTAATCGDGRVDHVEACDDGNAADGDGCSSACALEEGCASPSCAPEPPRIRGAASMAPGRALWTWSQPEGSTRVELRLDGEPLDTPDQARLSVPLSPGEHTLEARACSASACSPWATHRTVAEAFGQSLPVGLVDTARKFARTSLGHAVAIGCERCASDAEGAPLSPAATASALERAVARGSDLIALSVASVGGELRVSPQDTATGAGLPRLADVLALPALRDGDALVLLDLAENEPRLADAVTPVQLAEALRDAFADAPTLARNGRPLLVRTSHGNRVYLSALREALTEAPELAPYVRYVLRDPEGAIAEFYALDALSSEAPLVPSLDFVDAVSFGYAAPDLPNRITLSRRAGRAVIIEGVPGSGAQHGHALLAALRDQADVIVTRYQPDRAQALVRLENRSLYFDSAKLRASATSIPLWYDTASGAKSVDQALTELGGPLVGTAAPSGALAPALAFGPGTQGRFLEAPADAGGAGGSGFLSAAFGGFSGPYTATDGRASSALAAPPVSSFGVVVNTAQAAEFGAFLDTEVVAACGSPLDTLLSGTATHWFVLYLDVRWNLLVDGKCAVAKPVATPLLARAKQGTKPRILSSGSVVSAASLLRFPTGYENDAAF